MWTDTVYLYSKYVVYFLEICQVDYSYMIHIFVEQDEIKWHENEIMLKGNYTI